MLKFLLGESQCPQALKRFSPLVSDINLLEWRRSPPYRRRPGCVGKDCHASKEHAGEAESPAKERQRLMSCCRKPLPVVRRKTGKAGGWACALQTCKADRGMVLQRRPDRRK